MSDNNYSLHPLHEAALDADRVFQLALVKEYGSYLASYMRYRTKDQTVEIQALGRIKQAADSAWLKELQERALEDKFKATLARAQHDLDRKEELRQEHVPEDNERSDREEHCTYHNRNGRA